MRTSIKGAKKRKRGELREYISGAGAEQEHTRYPQILAQRRLGALRFMAGTNTTCARIQNVVGALPFTQIMDRLDSRYSELRWNFPEIYLVHARLQALLTTEGVVQPWLEVPLEDELRGHVRPRFALAKTVL